MFKGVGMFKPLPPLFTIIPYSPTHVCHVAAEGLGHQVTEVDAHRLPEQEGAVVRNLHAVEVGDDVTILAAGGVGGGVGMRR
jgi:hypothetical protein